MQPELEHLKRAGVTLFLDVGANAGQTGHALRRGGYAGRIASFEPIAECHARLAEAAGKDPAWQTFRLALGARRGVAEIGVSANLVSSSLRPATPGLVALHPPVGYVRRESVPVERLDAVLEGIAGPHDVIHLKIDTQGSEREVIEGAAGILARLASVRMEVAVTAVYEGEMELPEALILMRDRGFVLIEAWPAWRHPATGEVLHFDLLFRRR